MSNSSQNPRSDNRSRIGRLAFYGSLVGVIILIQSPVGQKLADATLGFEWSAPIFHFLRANTQGFLLLFLLSLFFDLFARRDLERLLEKHRLFSAETIENQLAQLVAPRALVEHGLESMYPTIPSFRRAIDALDLEKPPFTRVTVDIHLTTSKEQPARNCTFNLNYSFDATLDRFRVAFTASANITETLIASGLVDEVITLEREAELAEVDDHKIADIQLVRIEGDHVNRLEFKRLSDRKVRRLLGSTLPEGQKDCALFEAKAQAKTPGQCRFKFSNTCELSVSEGYCYWTSPRTLFLSTLTIDTSRFPNRDQWSFIFQPFLGNARLATDAMLGPDRYSLDLQEWIVRGQGVAVIWSSKNPAAGEL